MGHGPVLAYCDTEESGWIVAEPTYMTEPSSVNPAHLSNIIMIMQSPEVIYMDESCSGIFNSNITKK